jgi:cellulose synthase/poly-beta-1,6-N-acetylglucosamine synthase-like glycosyltransferase
MTEAVFFLSLSLIAYVYLLFPLLLMLRGLVWRRGYRKAEITPAVSVIIVAHNEAGSIGAKLDNLRQLDYPSEQLEIVVASDGSTDGTNELVRGYADRGVRLLELPRQGKIPALNAAVAQVSGEVLVFSDANSMFARHSLRQLVAPFADPRIGAVAGNQCYSRGAANTASIGERMYWNFDRLLKQLQSKSGSVIAATGAIYAIRRALFRTVPSGVSDDFVISARAIEQGYWLAFDPDAVAYEPTAASDEAEFARRTRVAVRALRALWVLRRLFNPLRYGFYAVQLASHKLLRYSVGWLLIALFTSSVLLYTRSPWYAAALWSQVACYVAAAIAMVLRNTRWRRWLKPLAIPYYFCLVNVAATRAWVQVLRGARVDVWDSRRHAAPVETAKMQPKASGAA